MSPEVKPFHDPLTGSFSYVVSDASGHAAIIDPVLDYEPRASRVSTRLADEIVAWVTGRSCTVDWILDTHVHADHLTAAGYLKDRLGGQVAIGAEVCKVQQTFAQLFNLGPDFPVDGSQFDRLFKDGDTFAIGTLQARVMALPGHTSDSVAYLIGNAAFIGDSLFVPERGTARCDFPGGDARRLHESVQQLYALPPDTALFLCHDYPAEGAAPQWQTTVQSQRENNVMLDARMPIEEFVRRRTERDRGLPVPALLLPAVQVNIRAGRFPEAEENGVRYLKIPLDRI